MNIDRQTRQKLEQFALKHKLILEEQGEVGFGRCCIGYTRGGNYVDYNPLVYPDLLPAFPDDPPYRLPAEVKNAYHKYDCLAVLVRDGDYVEAFRQLSLWVDDLESKQARLVQYATGATGLQALLSGVYAYAFRFNCQEK